MIDVIDYRPKVVHFEGPYGPTQRIVHTQKTFAEWLINGVPFTDLLARAYTGRDARSFVFVPAVSWGVTAADDVERLLLRRPADLPSGRQSLLTCPVCGDTGCTCVSAVVERDGDAFVWRAFGWENNYDEDAPWLDEFVEMGPLRFDSARYERVLRAMNAMGVTRVSDE